MIKYRMTYGVDWISSSLCGYCTVYSSVGCCIGSRTAFMCFMCHELQGRLDELNSWMKREVTVHLSAIPSILFHEQVDQEFKDVKVT